MKQAGTSGNNVFRLRGNSMTRIETFVAAAFAFALSMLVISLDEIPENMQDFVAAVKNIPSFLASCALIVWIWFNHADWSRRYGLEDGRTIILSGTLICIVLIYMYPLRLMMQGMFMMISGGYLPFEMDINAYWQLRFLFIFYAAGFTLLSLNFMALYHHARRSSETLSLTQYELYYTTSALLHWASTFVVCLIIVIVTLSAPNSLLVYSPFLYVLLWPVNHWVQLYRQKHWQQQN